MSRSSVMEREIGPHDHKMVILLSYEVYAVCKLCGFHDWSEESDTAYLAKYPGAEVIDEFAAEGDAS